LDAFGSPVHQTPQGTEAVCGHQTCCDKLPQRSLDLGWHTVRPGDDVANEGSAMVLEECQGLSCSAAGWSFVGRRIKQPAKVFAEAKG
jgi:hypothetical protein